MAIQSQYLNEEILNKIKLEAEAQLENIFCSGNERNFTLYLVASRLTSAFEGLAQYGEPKPEDEKVRRLVSAIKVSSQQLAVAVVPSQTTNNSSFNRTLDFFGAEVSWNMITARIERGVSAVQTGRSGVSYQSENYHGNNEKIRCLLLYLWWTHFPGTSAARSHR